MTERSKPTESFGAHDAIYDELLSAYYGLSTDRQRQLTASLLICLCHRIGSREEISRALAEARASLPDDTVR
ncbi:MAG: DUF2783 domain-containing protein [Rhodobacteraceae bacterium]|nr:DUF2783 domain-containing protein [Paracoccaceae bacterium]